MSINKLALIRYKTIDECLQNRFRKWTLDDLIDKVSEAIYEYEGITTGISKRTVQADIQLMRSDKLGYNAPITIIDKKYYAYEDKQYSISKAPINNTDVEKLKEVLNVLKQFNGFNYFGEMTEMVVKLENTLYKSSKKSRNCIQFESNRQLKGIDYINGLYRAILQKKTLLIEYQSFKAHKPHQNIYYPYLLKEYRNRWFLIGKRKNHVALSTLALDRISSFEEVTQEIFIDHAEVDFDAYYSDLIGVTKSEKDIASKVVLQIDAYNTPYILTKPLHPSQTVLKQTETSVIISIDVVLNFELEREILGFGQGIKVLAPRLLVKKIKERLRQMYDLYQIDEKEPDS